MNEAKTHRKLKDKETVRAQRLVRRRGRVLKVNGETWTYRVGRGGGVVAYRDDGKKMLTQAWRLKGFTDPNTWGRGQWKRTSDGMVTPREVAGWLASPNEKLTDHD